LQRDFLKDIEAVIFDMDGLMLDTERLAREAWKRAMHDFGYELPDKVYQQMIGRNRRDKTGIFTEAFDSDFPLDNVGARKDEYLLELLESDIPLKPGLMPLLHYLETTSLKTAVASSTLKDEVLRRVHLLGLFERFDTIVGGDDVERGKPHPDIFLYAASQLNTHPKDCLVLEDSEAGVQAASSAGMEVWIVPDVKEPAAEILALVGNKFDSLHGVLAEITGNSVNEGKA